MKLPLELFNLKSPMWRLNPPRLWGLISPILSPIFALMLTVLLSFCTPLAWALGARTSTGVEGAIAPNSQVTTSSVNAVSALNTKTDKEHVGPMLTLGINHLPMTDVIKTQEKENFYACPGLVADWFLSLASEEMNYFATQSKLVSIDKSACIISIENEKSLTPGLITMRLYQTTEQLHNCIDHHKCQIEHNLTLVIKHNVVYRSYFLTDLQHGRYVEHCVSDQGQWFKNTNCYKVE